MTTAALAYPAITRIERDTAEPDVKGWPLERLDVKMPGAARRMVRAFLVRRMPTAVLDELMVAVGEILANAHRHGRGERVIVTAIAGKGVAVVKIRYETVRFKTGKRPDSTTAESGRGLNIVHELTKAGFVFFGGAVRVELVKRW